MLTGAWITPENDTLFRIWAPYLTELQLCDAHGKKLADFSALEKGYLECRLPGNHTGLLYYINSSQGLFPDPASRSQPQGVQGPSEVISAHFPWTDQEWQAGPLAEQVLYEIHTGTFSSSAGFDGILPHLQELKYTGITCLELMPIAQFPGSRNWGYDGVLPWAVQNSYGGPQGLHRLVDACHRIGLGVVLDVVYNHLGPEGNILPRLGPYFTDRYHTPWGQAVNLDGPGSYAVRDFLIQNALFWLDTYHIDGLRLDAVHAIFDQSARHFLSELSERISGYCRETGKNCYLIAESDLNDPRVVSPCPQGYGFDAQWLDDWHHSIHSLITGESRGYYQDFGSIEHLLTSYTENFVYSGQYSSHRDRDFGGDASGLPGSSFIAFTQNHDHIGNRPLGERLVRLAGAEAARLAAGALVLSPFIPLLFMGEEFAADQPFLYFVNHNDPGLLEAVRRGRREEFAGLMEGYIPPDPDDENTWKSSILDWEAAEQTPHQQMRAYYRTLLSLRRQWPSAEWCDPSRFTAWSIPPKKVLCLMHRFSESRILGILNFDVTQTAVCCDTPGSWSLLLDSSALDWGGPGSALETEWDGTEQLILPGKGLAIYHDTGYNQL